MHEDFNYDDEHDYDDSQDKYKHYFKFDPAAWDAWGKFLYESLNSIVDNPANVWYAWYGFPSKSIPVNSYFSITGKGNSFQYLGNNYQGYEIWKKKYLIADKLDSDYIKHIQSNAIHFLQQPHYYNGMFDILN